MAPLFAVLRTSCLALLSYAATAAASGTTRPGDIDGSKAKPKPLTPSDDAIQRNAFSIFNAVHSATRQWGSSLNHNGMSIFLATVPEGQLLYHGGDEPHRAEGITKEGFDWLAFELEHAQMFGRGRGERRPPWSPPGEGPPEEGPPGGSPGEGTPGGRTPRGETDEWNVVHSHYNRRSLHRAMLDDDELDQKPLGHGDDDKPKRPQLPDLDKAFRGYFHTYRANRPLNLLYIDGMSAGKTDFGCVDTQDLMLLGWSRSNGRIHLEDKGKKDKKKPGKGKKGKGGRGGQVWGGELDRAKGLCDMAKDWSWDDKGSRIDGFVRTEAGFEIIYCDLSEAGGLDVVTIQASPFGNETGGLPMFVESEFLRGVSLRYHGFPAGRIHVDWSSMVSAFFYDVNLTNPDASRPELPRLLNVTRSERRGIRARIQDVVAARGPLSVHKRHTIDWQGIVDMVVTRYSQRLDQLVRGTSKPITELAGQMIPTLLYAYMNSVDRDEPHALQLERCTKQYLWGALERKESWTPEDRSIYLALETVTSTICTSLFDIRSVIYNESANAHTTTADGDAPNLDEEKEIKVREIVTNLMGKLQWTTWKQCDPCQHPDELCLVAMFPWGDADDHFHPKCNTMENIQFRNGYWRLDQFD